MWVKGYFTTVTRQLTHTFFPTPSKRSVLDAGELLLPFLFCNDYNVRGFILENVWTLRTNFNSFKKIPLISNFPLSSFFVFASKMFKITAYMEDYYVQVL